MLTVLPSLDPSRASLLRLHQPSSEPAVLGGEARWSVNGWVAIVTVYSAEDWAHLDDRPSDAQRCSNGTWATLRLA